MASRSQPTKGRDSVFSMLNVAIVSLNLAKDIAGITPAVVAFGSVSVLLTMIRDSMANEREYVDIGMFCFDVCEALKRGLNGKQLHELNQSASGAIEQLKTTVADIQEEVIKHSKRSAVSRAFYARNDKDTIAILKQNLSRILHIFNTELAMNTHTMIQDIHESTLAGQPSTDKPQQLVRSGSIYLGNPVLGPHGACPGEMPPPPPGACFGRDDLIAEIVGLAENLKSVALIGAGGIGKTSTALTVLHHDRIKDRFGDNRRFIRCDQIPASCAHFLARLSQVVGAGVQNPEDLTPLRPILSSQEMIIILDNAESILDPQGTDSQEIYAVVDQLCQFETISLLITSRITTVPGHCRRPTIPTLSREAASDIFYSIYNNGGRSDIIDGLLERLDYHALSITLLATTASHNMWDYERLAKEWEAYRGQVLRTDHSKSLAATIELSLASPTFRKLGPRARDILGVVGFFPQGVDEKKIDWLFSTIQHGTGMFSRLSSATSEGKAIFDKLCILSLTYRNNGFITMLAPIRDYLRPQGPKPSSLLRATKDLYFTRLSANISPDKPGFKEAEWIKSEDVNVEHLLFTSIDSNKPEAWKACTHFLEHLYWHKPRKTVLRSKIEGLPDDHPSKSACLTKLSLLSQSLGNFAEQKRLLSQVIKLERGRNNADQVARALKWSSDANRMLGLYEEGIKQVNEALEIYKRVGNVTAQAESLEILAWLLYDDEKYDAAEEAVARSIYLFTHKGNQFQVCQSHHLLGNICRKKGERKKAIHHFEESLRIATHFDWRVQLFWAHYSLALLYRDEDAFEDAHTHVERAKSHVGGREHLLGRAMELQGRIWHRQGRLEDARSGVLRANEVFERLGAFDSRVEKCRDLLREIEEEIELRNQSASDEPGDPPLL